MNSHREAWLTPTQSGTRQVPSLSVAEANVSAPPSEAVTRSTTLQTPRALGAEGRSRLKTRGLTDGRSHTRLTNVEVRQRGSVCVQFVTPSSCPGEGTAAPLPPHSGYAVSPVSSPCLPDRPQPPSKPVVQQEDVKARSVLLSWEPGSDGLSPVRYYTIQTRELPSGRWALHSASVSHNASAFTVDR